MSDFRQPLIALDVETTGLDEREAVIGYDGTEIGGDRLLQVAAIAFDGLDRLVVPENEPVAFNGYISVDPFDFQSLYNQSNEYVKDMHEKSNVWASISNERMVDIGGKVDTRFSSFHETNDDLDNALYSWIDSVFDGARPDLIGASITLDRNFLRQYVPHSYNLINYRNMDVSSVRNFLIGANQKTFKFENKDAEHNGLDDALFTAVHAAALADNLFGGNRAETLLSQMQNAGLPYESIQKAFDDAVLSR